LPIGGYWLLAIGCWLLGVGCWVFQRPGLLSKVRTDTGMTLQFELGVGGNQVGTLSPPTG
jgi:hypothetical protein